MNNIISSMLERYDCQTENDYTNALKEVFQEIALLGLWRAKFFEHAAFYGGTALRILYGLDRFSEDMDFSLLRTNMNFALDKYNEAIVSELSSFGFHVTMQTKTKTKNSQIQSAFIKANTMEQLITIDVPQDIVSTIHKYHHFKIKMEIDIDPPEAFKTETKVINLPIPFTVLAYKKEYLFAGKLHALLCRKWQQRVKGRDWYDYYWYVSRKTPVSLNHLQSRLIQSQHWDASKQLTHKRLVSMIYEKISKVDFENAKKDVVNFLKDESSVTLWSEDFFKSLTDNLISQ